MMAVNVHPFDLEALLSPQPNRAAIANLWLAWFRQDHCAAFAHLVAMQSQHPEWVEQMLGFVRDTYVGGFDETICAVLALGDSGAR